VVAEDERVGSAMTVIDVPRHGAAALADDDPAATYAVADRLSRSSAAARGSGAGLTVRAIVEVQRRLGGMAPRAVVGGEFTTSDGNEAVFEVLAGASYESLVESGRRPESAVTSLIYPEWRFVAGLPHEYAASALDGLAEGPCARLLPAGILRLDRAAFDEIESAGPVFAQASAALCCVLAAKVEGRDVDAALRAAVERW
jgi:hypothetical protein